MQNKTVVETISGSKYISHLGSTYAVDVEAHPKISFITWCASYGMNERDWVEKQDLPYAKITLYYDQSHHALELLRKSDVRVVDKFINPGNCWVEVEPEDLGKALEALEMSSANIETIKKYQKNAAETRERFMNNLTLADQLAIETIGIRSYQNAFEAMRMVVNGQHPQLPSP